MQGRQWSGDGAQGGQYGTELFSKQMFIQSKRFYIDVKENKRGRFMKLVEVGIGGQRSHISFDMTSTKEFLDRLTEFCEVYASLGPAKKDKPQEDIKSASISRDERKYHLDLKENAKGRFLKVTMIISASHDRSQIVIPAQGMIDLRDTISDIITEFGKEDIVVAPLPGDSKSRSLQTDSKTFHFDIGQNNRGTFLRIAEVFPNFRAAVTIPSESWDQFKELVGTAMQQTTTSTEEYI